MAVEGKREGVICRLPSDGVVGCVRMCESAVETSSSRVSGLPQGNIQMYWNINLGTGRGGLSSGGAS